MCCILMNSLTGDSEFLDVWDDAYASIMRYSRATDGFWVRVPSQYLESFLTYFEVSKCQHENRRYCILFCGFAFRFLARSTGFSGRRTERDQTTLDVCVVLVLRLSEPHPSQIIISGGDILAYQKCSTQISKREHLSNIH